MLYAGLNQSKVNRTLMKIGGVGAIASGVLFVAGLILQLLFGFGVAVGLITLLAWVALIPVVPAFYEAAKDRSGALAPIGTFAGAVGVVLGLIGGIVQLSVAGQADIPSNFVDLLSVSLRQFAYVLVVGWLALNGLVNVRLGKASRHWFGFGWYSLITAGLVTILAVIWLLGVVNLEVVVVGLLGVAVIWLGVSLLQTK